MKKILVIDDDDSFRTSVVNALRKQGYEILEAGSGEDGLQVAGAQSPDLVVSDVNMPGIDGFGVLKSLRAQPVTSAIPVILMTGGSELQGLRQGMEHGADDYLAKPFAMSGLVAAVRARLARQETIQAQAKATESKLLELLSISQDLIAITDAEARQLLYLNAAGRKMLGLRAEDDIFQLRLAGIQADTSKVEQARREGIWVGENEFVRRDGSSVPVSTQILAHRGPGGETTYLSIVARDVTELKQAAEEVAKSQQLLRTILDILPQRVFWKDCNGHYAGANKRFLEDCGVTELTGKSDHDLPWSREQTESFQADDQRVIESGRPKLDIVEELTASSGKTLWLSTSKVPMRDSAGTITGVLGTYLDITSLKEAEHARQMMEVQLRQVQKLEAIGQLAAGIAHEINTPIQYVSDNTRFLQDSFKDLPAVLKSHEELIAAAKNNTLTPEVLARAEKILNGCDLAYLLEQVPIAISETLEGIERVTKIVRAMKEFSHPGGKEKALADLNKAIETTVTVARNEWKYVAEVRLDLDAQLPPVPCFLGEFNQVILNLIINASHAIADVVKDQPGAKGTITVRTRRDGDFAEVRVADTGTGIPEHVRPRIFEPFFTTKGVGKGTGQGLSIVYGSIVKKHGGDVRFETETGRGTTFILRLALSPHP
jgi:PAS domain S-box-containing protein